MYQQSAVNGVTDAGQAQAERWFPRLGRTGEVRLRLFCFPFAGGSAASFAQWPQTLVPGVEMRALQLPGRGTRINETPVHRIDLLIPDLLRAIQPFADRPMVFYGHSNGALLAYELACHLPPAARSMLRHLILSAKAAPHVAAATRWHLMADEELTQELKVLGGTPPELLAHEELMRLLLPMMRADFALSATYQPPAGREPLAVPVSLWWGERDTLARADKVQAWQQYFTASAQSRSFDGGHFYLNEQREAVLGRINQLLRSYI